MSTFRSAHSEIQDKISVRVYIVTETVLFAGINHYGNKYKIVKKSIYEKKYLKQNQ